MKAISVNGSPRKKWNTATLLKKALEGAASEGAKTGLVHLYDLDYKGCISCFACKMKDGKSCGKCAVKDGLTPLLKKVNEADVIFLGSPIYFRNGHRRDEILHGAPLLSLDDLYRSSGDSLFPKGPYGLHLYHGRA